MNDSYRTHAGPVAAALGVLTPAVAVVRLSPVWTDTYGGVRRQTLVTLHDDLGRHLIAGLGAHRHARDVIRQAFADLPPEVWDRQWVYDVDAGELAPPRPFEPSQVSPRRPGHDVRRGLLAVEIARQGGQWTTGRVRAWGACHGAPKRSTAGRDLVALFHGGFLAERVAADGHVYYVHPAPRESVGGVR